MRKTTSMIRRGDYADASSALNQALQILQPILLSRNGSTDFIKKATYSLETIFLMQKQYDWVAVADIIEFEFLEILSKEFSENNSIE